ncbi:diguanylate cyclase domain-containing protein [Lichenifustis flavocetrariae]|uniref:Diguanylate cyclase n=1 Tax=Lichenifustis flavocetrariae TaxID=2949735 RepID=A0AA42CMI6_9HYPH|nr:diguanylate cyclase [Lichenifustis flavocetrariae]MCW6512724.1 diguanylate cyclase [Lichenifustis flavocetrariae]
MLGAEVKLLLEACPSAVIVLDPAEHVAFGNRDARDLFGLGEALVGTPVAVLVLHWPLPNWQGSRVVLRVCGGQERSCTVRASSHPGPDGPVTTVWIDRDQAADPAVSDAELRLRYVIDMLPQAICMFDADDRYVLWNQRYAELYADIAEHLRPGIAFEDILKLSLKSGQIQEVIADPDAWLKERMAKFRRQLSQEEQQLRNGRWLRHDDRRTPDGGAIGIRIDITELKQREEWLRQLFDANPMPMLLCDGRSLAILEVNRAAVAFYGFAEADMLAKAAEDMHIPDQKQAFVAKVLGGGEARTVWRQRMADGQERHVLIHVRMLQKHGDCQVLLTVADVTDRVLAEVEATRLANHDVLTGLPNRMQFYRALDDALQPEGRARVAVYCLDLDGFKPVNDEFGHAVGDEVLKSVAERLRAVAKEHLVARLGGDEFAVLVRDWNEIDTDLADRCVGAFRKPFVIRTLPITLGVSIGIAAAETAGTDRDALVQAADGMLYQAKAAGRNTWRMTPAEVPGSARAAK